MAGTRLAVTKPFTMNVTNASDPSSAKTVCSVARNASGSSPSASSAITTGGPFVPVLAANAPESTPAVVSVAVPGGTRSPRQIAIVIAMTTIPTVAVSRRSSAVRRNSAPRGIPRSAVPTSSTAIRCRSPARHRQPLAITRGTPIAVITTTATRGPETTVRTGTTSSA